MTTAGWTLRELAQQFDLVVRGDPDWRITGLHTLSEAGPDALSFLANRRYLGALKSSKAGAVLVHPAYADEFAGNVLITEQPYLVYARISRLLEQAELSVEIAHQVHPLAQVASSARIEPNVSLGAFAVVGERVLIGTGTVVAAGVVIGDDCQLGEHCQLAPQVVLYRNTVLGQRVRVQAGTVIGSDGFGFAPSPAGWERIAQLGRVVIGDDCDIGANTTIDRGALGDTVLGKGVIIDNQVQIAHNVHIGNYTAIAACVGISGSSRIGKRCVLAGGVGLVGHIQIADDVQLTGMTMVTKSIQQSGSYSSGTAFEPTADWKKTAVRLKNLEQLLRRITVAERQLEELSISAKKS